jgi:protein-S-isoprenylcysteine O-methyltransferase Ste14
VIVAFFIVQRQLRRTKVARSLRGGPQDKGNAIVIGSVTGIGLLLPIIFDLVGIGIFSISIIAGSIALVVMFLGFALRVWAARTLGKYYTTTLMTIADQKVVSSGPYATIRHPGYLAEILLWTGFGVLSSNLIVLFSMPALFTGAYMYRISSEEKMLVRELGKDYKEYQKRTKRILPYLF